MVVQLGTVGLEHAQEGWRPELSDEQRDANARNAAYMGLIVGIPGGPLVMATVMVVLYLLPWNSASEITLHLLFLSVLLMPFTLLAGAGLFSLAFYTVRRIIDGGVRRHTGPVARPTARQLGGLFLHHVHTPRLRRRKS